MASWTTFSMWMAKPGGIVEAKKEGITLTGVETQSEKYTKGLLDKVPAWSKSLPLRRIGLFSFQKPETVAEWLEVAALLRTADLTTDYSNQTGTFLVRMHHMPALREWQ